MLQIHWFSIFNSFMMVLFLTGLVAVILMRTLRKDYARYARSIEDDMEALEVGGAVLFVCYFLPFLVYFCVDFGEFLDDMEALEVGGALFVFFGGVFVLFGFF